MMPGNSRVILVLIKFVRALQGKIMNIFKTLLEEEPYKMSQYFLYSILVIYRVRFVLMKSQRSVGRGPCSECPTFNMV